MTKTKLTFILFSFFFIKVTCQILPGKYIGQAWVSTSYKTDKHGKQVKAIKAYTDKILELNSDSTFTFSFTFFNLSSSQGMQDRSCNGFWKVRNDTVYLSSRYSMKDFCKVEERYIPTKENKLIKISIITPEDSITPTTWINHADIDINFKRVGKCDLNDTLYCKSDSVKKIRLITSSPSAMEWNYNPTNTESNYFAFHLRTWFKGDNICLEGYRLLIENGELIPLDYGALYVDEGNYRRQK